MKQSLILSAMIPIILFFTPGSSVTGQTADEFDSWTAGTAFVLPSGRWEMGLFGPLRCGITSSMELSTCALSNLAIPNLSLKWSHKPVGEYLFATRHSVYSPTPALRTVAREGIGGLISPEFTIPNMASLYNELLVSRQVAPGYLLTGKLGLEVALRSDTPDSRTTIDLPIIYPRLQVFYHVYGIRSGFDLLGRLYRRWHFMADVDVFIYPGGDQEVTFEHQGLLLWNKSSRFQLCLGYKLIYGDYPFGIQWHLLPLFDLQWGW